MQQVVDNNLSKEGGITAGRFKYIDNLKVFLTLLVIFHHVAITYGAGGSWYYLEHGRNETINVILSVFTTFNQTFFMSFFFLISGFFTPGAFERKGIKSFFKDRLVRLGIPLLVFTFTLSPIVEYIKYLTSDNGQISFWDFYMYNNVKSFNFCPGPLWYVETLLIFSVIYCLIRLITNKFVPKISKNNSSNTKELNIRKTLIFILFLSVFTFAVRILFPIGNEYFHLQLGFFPHYISLFIMGVIGYKRNLQECINGITTRFWLTSSILIFFIAIITCISWEDKALAGGFTIQSLFVSTAQSYVCVGLCIGLTGLFKKRFNTQKSRLSQLLPENSYCIYIIHAPVVVLVALVLKSINLFPLIKFLQVSFLGVIICFLISNFIIRKLPYVKKVL